LRHRAGRAASRHDFEGRSRPGAGKPNWNWGFVFLDWC
jgi:hypothetical protein